MKPQAELEELFISERRQPMSRITVWFLIKQTAAAAGLQGLDIHPHSLRHSCGYSLVNKGTDIRVIQDTSDIARPAPQPAIRRE